MSDTVRKTSEPAWQWGRKISLITAASGKNEGLELSELHIKFQTTHMISTTPATLTARIYNLSKETVKRLQADLPDTPQSPALTTNSADGGAGSADSGRGKIVLKAGYEGNYGVIFKGDVMQIIIGRESPIDTYIDIFAADGDWGHTWGKINSTLAAGWTADDVSDQTRKSLAAFGLTTSDLPESLQQTSASRGKVLFGRTRDIQRELGRNYMVDSFVKNGNVEWLPAAAYLPGESVEVNARSGMIGWPRQTNFGLTARMLLNPSVGTGNKLIINNKSIQRQQFTAGPDQTYPNSILQGNISVDLPDTDSDGEYKVLGVDHIGDTRGNDWYTDVVCMAVRQRGVNAIQPPGYYGYPVF